jgi:hypothetical protein
MRSPLTSKTIELVLPIKLLTRFMSLISASEAYRFQYVADVSPYLGALITPKSEMEISLVSQNVHLGSTLEFRTRICRT